MVAGGLKEGGETADVPGKSDIQRFVREITGSDKRAKEIVGGAKTNVAALVRALGKMGFSASFTELMARFLKDARKRVFTKKRFETIAKCFSLWASYQKTTPNPDKEETEFELPIRIILAGRHSVEGRYLAYYAALRETLDETAGKMKTQSESKLASILRCEVLKAGLVLNHFGLSSLPDSIRWPVSLYLINRMGDEELAELLTGLRFGDGLKKDIVGKVRDASARIGVLELLWAKNADIDLAGLLKGRNLAEFCRERGCHEEYAGILEQAGRKADALAEKVFQKREPDMRQSEG